MIPAEETIRATIFPRFDEEMDLSDEELAKLLKPERGPEDAALAAALPDMAAKAARSKDMIGPLEVPLYSGPAAGREAEIALFNWDKGKPLLGLAAMNEIFVHDGNVYGLPQDPAALSDRYEKIYESGTRAEFRFIDLIVAGFAARVESAIASGAPGPIEERWKIAKRPEQLNLSIPEAARDFIQRSGKHIRVGGPLFFGLKAVWK